MDSASTQSGSIPIAPDVMRPTDGDEAAPELELSLTAHILSFGGFIQLVNTTLHSFSEKLDLFPRTHWQTRGRDGNWIAI